MVSRSSTVAKQMTLQDLWLHEAVALAAQSVRSGGVPFAALVVSGERLLGRGVNRVRTDCDPTAHAEIVAIRDACRQIGTTSLIDATLVASAEPCALCLMAATWAGVQRVIYAADCRTAAAAGFDYCDSAILTPARGWPMPIIQRPIAKANLPFRTWRTRAARTFALPVPACR